MPIHWYYCYIRVIQNFPLINRSIKTAIALHFSLYSIWYIIMHLVQVQYNFLDLCYPQILHTVVYTYVTLLEKASLVYSCQYFEKMPFWNIQLLKTGLIQLVCCVWLVEQYLLMNWLYATSLSNQMTAKFGRYLMIFQHQSWTRLNIGWIGRLWVGVSGDNSKTKAKQQKWQSLECVWYLQINTQMNQCST